jgi:hypothetical protein
MAAAGSGSTDACANSPLPLIQNSSTIKQKLETGFGQTAKPKISLNFEEKSEFNIEVKNF